MVMFCDICKNREAKTKGLCKKCYNREYARKWRSKNSEYYKQYCKSRYDANAETMRDKSKSYRLKNPQKVKDSQHKWYLKNEEKVWEYNINKHYGISKNDYIKLLELQGNRCIICEQKCEDRLSIDHDHDTYKIRGLVCNRCNLLIGYIENTDINLIKRVIKYLKSNEEKAKEKNGGI